MARIPDYNNMAEDMPMVFRVTLFITLMVIFGKVGYEFLKHIGVF
jgi:hypothetical protein